MDRRTFLKIAGMGSLSFAAGCTSEPEKSLFSLVEAPDDMVTGQATWYASTCRECPAGCGTLAKNREGRVVKLEGNPLHPINRGRLCMRGHAALQVVYNPGRLQTPLLKEKGGWKPISFSRAVALVSERAETAAGKGSGRVRMMTEIVGEGLMWLFSDSLEKWGSTAATIFEPYAYEGLKTAGRKVFGKPWLPSYRMEKADFLLSFGADFLETWLSPVEYALKFKEMHALKHGEKGLFFHVSPYQSLTCANADLWISCKPGGEASVALGLLREAYQSGMGRRLPRKTLLSIEKISSPYTKDRVAQLSGVPKDAYEKMVTHLFRSKRPLVLGTGVGTSGCNDLQANMASYLLNLVLDPDLTLFDFDNRHRVELAAKRSEILEFFHSMKNDPVDLLLLNNVNPAYHLPPSIGVKEILVKDSLFAVSLSNFMDETSTLSDLIIPVRSPLESWDEYEGKHGMLSIMQPAMGSLTGAPSLGDLFLDFAFSKARAFKSWQLYLYASLLEEGRVKSEMDWLKAVQRGGLFEPLPQKRHSPSWEISDDVTSLFDRMTDQSESASVFMATPSIRFFDGRGANRPWLCEIPDPMTKVAWQTPVLMNPKDLISHKLKQGDIIGIKTEWGELDTPVYETEGVRQGVLVMCMGQGHEAYGPYAEGMGINPVHVLPHYTEPLSGAPFLNVAPVTIHKTGRTLKLAHTDGSRIQHGRDIALSISLKDLRHGKGDKKHHNTLTLPIPEGYDRKKDVYPPHPHKDYRWAMVVDLDRCIGCGACSAACYAENNIGVVGLARILEGREMSWIRIERYFDHEDKGKLVFLPMLCQHCDNAPCESVCPVYAPHHSKEGLNNQIYNRCIGTRFCSQNCPYKVRRFNWFSSEWPEPFNLQLNPDVTVRSKGVMEKCSFCVQRIKEAHGRAKDENRKILDGEVQPACLQTCPTGVFTFGNLMDRKSRVRSLVEDTRAYQVTGYLNTKPAVIYLKKVIREI